MIIAITPNINLKRKVFSYSFDDQVIEYFKKFSSQIVFLNKFNYKKYLKKNALLVMTGGNDLPFLKKNKVNLKRYYDEQIYLSEALKNKIKIIGICRGFQHIMSYYNIGLMKKKGHVKIDHKIYDIKNKNNYIEVNSYHNYLVYELPKSFKKKFICNDGSLEIAQSKSKNILCTMFHPERYNIGQNKIDILFKNFIH